MKNILLISVLSSILLANSQPVFAQDEKEQTPAVTDSAADDKTKDASTPRATPNAHANKQREIAHLLTGSSTQVVKLNALDQEFEMYFLTSVEKEPLGSVLFFPDERNHSDWPITLNPLRTGLTEHNWQTAVLTLPATTLKKIPERSVYQATPKTPEETPEKAADSEPTDPEATSSPADDTNKANTPKEPKMADSQQEEDNTPNKSMAEQAMARASATRSYLMNSVEGVVIIGIGQGATWASAYASTLGEKDKDMSRLILINPQQSLDVSAPKLNPLIESLKIDTFDIYTPKNQTADKDTSTALQRKRAANLSEIENYRQIKAPASAWGKRGNDWLYRKVKGLIKNNIMQEFKEQSTKKALPTPPEKTNQKPGSTNTT